MKPTARLESIAQHVRSIFASRDATREKVLPLCREVIRHSSEAIRAAHRHEFDNAAQAAEKGRSLLVEIERLVGADAEVRTAGFVRDAQKEFAEASITLALITGAPLPDHRELGVEPAAYLNGMGEAVGELRRYLLDGLRGGDVSRSEELLSMMDDIYGVLVTMDFPDAITAGLRRTTDVVRGILEKTRGDLTLALRQRDLTARLEEFEKKLK